PPTAFYTLSLHDALPIYAREGFELPEAVDLIVADLSFISLRLALPPSFRHLDPGGAIVALVKPQFEAGREAVERGGIVRDRGARDRKSTRLNSSHVAISY